MYWRMNGHSGTIGSPRVALGVERAAGQRRAEALALERRVDLGVHEVRPAAAPVVDGEAGDGAVERDLVAVVVGDVADLDARRVAHGPTLRGGPPAADAGDRRPPVASNDRGS